MKGTGKKAIKQLMTIVGYLFSIQKTMSLLLFKIKKKNLLLFKLQQIKIKTADLRKIILLVKSEVNKNFVHGWANLPRVSILLASEKYFQFLNIVYNHYNKFFFFLIMKHNFFFIIIQGKYCLIPFTMQKGETAHFFSEIYFGCKENMVNFNFKSVERILEPCVIDIPHLRPVKYQLKKKHIMIQV